MSFDIGNGNQDDNASFDIGNGNQSVDVWFNIGNRTQDYTACIGIGNGNQGRDVSLNVCDRIQNGRDAIDGVAAKVLELAQAFQTLSTEGMCELVYIYTALYPIHVNCFLDIRGIPKYVP